MTDNTFEKLESSTDDVVKYVADGKISRGDSRHIWGEIKKTQEALELLLDSDDYMYIQM